MMAIKVLDRYLFGQLFWGSVFALVLFSIVWLAPETLFKLTQYFFGGNITLAQAFQMFAMHLPGALQQSIPVAALLGSLFVFQRLSGQFETISMFVAGVSMRRMLVPVVLVGVTFGLLFVVLNEAVVPVSGPALDSAYTKFSLSDRPDRNFIFVEKHDDGTLDRLFLIGQAQEDKLSDFVVLDYVKSASGLSASSAAPGVRIGRIIRANTGYWMSKDNRWSLRDGIEYHLNDEGVYQSIQTFDTQTIKTSKYAAKLLKYSTSNPKYLNFYRLNQYIRLLREGNQWQDVPYFEVRMYQKLVGPVSAIFFAVVGALLGLERIRARRSFSLMFGAILVFVYSILMPFSSNIAALTTLPVWIVAWFPLAACAIVSWGLLALKREMA
ncbi:MAG: LptF/LptG family permease [Vampirovibrionales bacterium]|nr:LptF/LptG family permease [Vampirovibrionales bacterium]